MGVVKSALMTDCLRKTYFPAIICAEFDSPIDALISLCVAHDEAMNLVAAAWRTSDPSCILATLDGGRTVAALRTTAGRWAACNVFLDQCSTSRSEAERQLKKRLKRGKRGSVVCWPPSDRDRE